MLKDKGRDAPVSDLRAGKNPVVRPATRFSRDLALQLKAAETASKKARALVERTAKDRARASERTQSLIARHMYAAVCALEAAGKAAEKLRIPLS